MRKICINPACRKQIRDDSNYCCLCGTCQHPEGGKLASLSEQSESAEKNGRGLDNSEALDVSQILSSRGSKTVLGKHRPDLIIEEGQKDSVTGDEDEKTRVDQRDLKAVLADLLGVQFPEWHALEAKAKRAMSTAAPLGWAWWLESSLSIGRRHLRKGRKCDLWDCPDLLVLKLRPNALERLLGKLIAILLAPWFFLKDLWNRVLSSISGALGPLFFILSVPLGIIAYLVDVITMITGFLFSIPRLLLSPFTLVRNFFLLIPRLLAKLVARLIWAFLAPVIDRALKKLLSGGLESLKNLLKRKPWIRYLILGFFRNERPVGQCILIPRITVSQFLNFKRTGLRNRGDYLIIVEGDGMVPGFYNRFRSWFRMLVLPYCWERTIHILCLPNSSHEKKRVLAGVSQSLDKPTENWQ